MKAVVWRGRKDVRVEEVPDPAVREHHIFRGKRDGAIKVLLQP